MGEHGEKVWWDFKTRTEPPSIDQTRKDLERAAMRHAKQQIAASKAK